MIRQLTLQAILAATLILAQNGQAAVLTPGPAPHCDWLLDGPTERGDLDKIKSRVKRGQRLCLNGPGGAYAEALDIAEFLINASVTTVLDRNARCYSACAIIFMSGSEFEELLLPKRKMHITARLGFHAPYIALSDGSYPPEHVAVAYDEGLRAVARMMTLGTKWNGSSLLRTDLEGGVFPRWLILELLKRGSSEVFAIDRLSRARALSIELLGASAIEWNYETACNACQNFHRWSGDDWKPVQSCLAKQHEPAQTRQLGPKGVEVRFSGFGGEGAYMCVVRLKATSSKKTELLIYPQFVTEDDFPLNEVLFTKVDTQFGLPPGMRLGD